jgi:hypothetical protein
MTDHTRFEEMAVGHVLGGLDAPASALFRRHLLDCRPCQARVAELRDLAGELAMAERQERAAQRLKTQTPTRRELEPPPQDDPGRRRRRLIGLAVAVVVAMGLVAWNNHLRQQNAALVETSRLRESTLQTLGTGEVIPVTLTGRVTGVVVEDGGRVAYSLAGLPDIDPGEALVVWLQTGEGMSRVRVHPAAQLGDGRLAAVIDAADASRLQISVEEQPTTATPTPPLLVDATLGVADRDNGP